jgi:hypothetical protein
MGKLKRCVVRASARAHTSALLVLLGVPSVELIEDLGGDTLEHLPREEAEELPPEVERVEDCAVLVHALVDKVLLELHERRGLVCVCVCVGGGGVN